MIKNIFKEHPHSVGETYLQHMRFAASAGFKMILGGIAALIHSVFPFIFTKKASEVAIGFISNLTDRLPEANDELKKLSEKIKLKSSQP